MKFIFSLFILIALICGARSQENFCSKIETLMGFNNSLDVIQKTDPEYELGTKFTTRVDGLAVGIKFFKIAGDVTVTRTGNIWSTSATASPLVSSVFSGESTDGWQITNENLPFVLPAGDYVVSVNIAQNGPYGYLDNYFTPSDPSVQNVNIFAPVDAGVYNGVPGSYPSGTYQYRNYYRDIMFTSFQNLYPTTVNPSSAAESNYELGTIFSSKTNGYIYAIRYYRMENDNTATHTGRIWGNGDQKELVSQAFPDTAPTIGWNTLYLSSPLYIQKNNLYTVSVNVDSGSQFSYTWNFFSSPLTSGDLFMPIGAGVYSTTLGTFPSITSQSDGGNHGYYRDVYFVADPLCESGPSGPTGLQGFTGPEGPTGIQGFTGPEGPTGPQGPTGPEGYTGPEGSTGLQGLSGPQGPTGVQGLTGPTGPSGLQGSTGVQGPTGLNGATGASGPKGDKGEIGDDGEKGERGATGPRGRRGNKGENGSKGEKGERGSRGYRGKRGVDGITRTVREVVDRNEIQRKTKTHYVIPSHLSSKVKNAKTTYVREADGKTISINHSNQDLFLSLDDQNKSVEMRCENNQKVLEAKCQWDSLIYSLSKTKCTPEDQDSKCDLIELFDLDENQRNKCGYFCFARELPIIQNGDSSFSCSYSHATSSQVQPEFIFSISLEYLCEGTSAPIDEIVISSLEEKIEEQEKEIEFEKRNEQNQKQENEMLEKKNLELEEREEKQEEEIKQLLEKFDNLIKAKQN
eukprot:TRINITY_DN601_c0_g1_i2.p1 TRINITY_DN601_c0_g1~~TRINITY_DN601_c0_g1_i2.p1  ORF type:complete len:743 (+),score=259.83 TRINITY_DN601_c0_g1_i2:37-2265(+)